MTNSLVPITPEEFRRTTMFRAVSYADVEHILTGCPLVKAEAGTVILRAGQTVERFYTIISGSVTVRLASADDEVLARFGDGEIFGEFAVIDGQPASAFVVAEAPCRLLGIDRAALWQLFEVTPQVAENLLSGVVARMRMSNRVIRKLQAKASGAPLDSSDGDGSMDTLPDPTETFGIDTL